MITVRVEGLDRIALAAERLRAAAREVSASCALLRGSAWDYGRLALAPDAPGDIPAKDAEHLLVLSKETAIFGAAVARALDLAMEHALEKVEQQRAAIRDVTR